MAAIPIDLVPLAIAVLIVFGAAVVRGYSGFGFSLLTVTALSLIYPTAEIVPSIFLLEIAASLHLLPGLWRDIHWRSVAPLLAGTFVATPVGIHFLASIPAAPMQVALAIFVLAATALLWRGFRLSTMPGPVASSVVGAAGGLANGAFGIGGPPVILFYFASPAGNAAGRASLVAYFMLTDTIGIFFLSRQGLLTWEAGLRALIFLLPLVGGVWLGVRSFRKADPAAFRNWVLAILAGLALLTAAKGIYGMSQ